jgi:hypothetical protein
MVLFYSWMLRDFVLRVGSGLARGLGQVKFRDWFRVVFVFGSRNCFEVAFMV